MSQNYISRSDDPEWVEEKMDGEIPLETHTCDVCSMQSPSLALIHHGKKEVYMCSKSFNSMISDLYYPDPVPQENLIFGTNHPCLYDLEDPF